MIEVLIPKDFVAYLQKIIFDEDATGTDLFAIVLMFAVLWFVVFYVVKGIIHSLVHDKPWLRVAVERDYDRATKKTLQDLNIVMTREEAIKWCMDDWPRMQALYIQHFVGSIFCIPSLLGIGDPSTASSLAICGVLSEMGWELQDMAEILFVRTFYENGKAIWPASIAIVFAVHHSLTTLLGGPMVFYYRNLKTLHWLCFDLQFAAGFALSISEYTKVLDITNNPRHLRQFKVLNFIALVTMVWTRVIHWTYLCIDLFITWYNEKAWVFLVVGSILSIGFTAFSWFVCVKPFYKKFLKFMHASAEYETLHSDATVEERRHSVINLQQAMGDLMAEDEMREIASILKIVFVERKVSRRQTMQPVSRRRRSLVMMLAKSSKSVRDIIHEVDEKPKYL